ncbi:DUF4214 domain-containing protein [Phaeobacter sp. J2-8]|uniref:DUF4214 domain-containing protein n=1 Tax=Phaeobacter sp. J2-8 TaxID=2931394 RepID=UPI001FD537F7|nr:DUF4214 domain-containing protein [Phaeobacter sp. J2-8]MCJ7871443.1 DUF4214 domain-containing protein [Phaeobacter sp. J2-8]
MVATLNYYGISYDFFGDAFNEADVTSQSATQVILTDQDTQFVTTINGFGFSNVQNDNVSGTVTSLQIHDAANNLVFSLSGVNWSMAQFVVAFDEIASGAETVTLEALLSLQPVNYNAATADMGNDISFSGVTQAVTIQGSAFADRFQGGLADDTINPGNTAEYSGNLLWASGGSDSYNVGNMGPNRYLDVSYEPINGPITANVNGNAGTMNVAKPGGDMDSFLNIGNVLDYGLGLWGTEANDTFNLNSGFGGWMQVNGMAGNDTFNLTLDGVVRLNYTGGYDGGPENGITANLASGVISDDGFGTTDTLNILGGTAGRLEIQGTRFDDNIIGSSYHTERFILERGNDTLDAGGGWDVVRYNRNGVEAINADMETGIITGTWWGEAFTHEVSNVEEIRGSYDGSDFISGDSNDNALEGWGGNDSLFGMGGEDDLYGGDGDDYLDPGDSNYGYDYVNPGAGNDQVELGAMQYGFVGISHVGLHDLTGLTLDLDMTIANGVGGVDASIDKGAYGTTALLNVDSALLADGAQIIGSDMADTFNVTLNDRAWLELRGGRGIDSYDLNTAAPDGENATIRLEFHRDAAFNRATQGLNIDLRSGMIANDGFGFQEQISGNYDYRLEIRGTDHADTIIGSHRNESFIGRGGNDMIDGLGGWDRLRFDRSDIDTGVHVDLGAGTASGVFDGYAFNYTIANIEEVRGTNAFNDQIFGSTSGEYFDGRGGNDRIFGDGAAAGYYTGFHANYIYRLYQATLDREPDAGGHTAWTQRYANGEYSALDVADGFVRSPQFKATYSDNLSNTEFVTLLYNNVLDRAPDDQGLARWVDELDSGASRADVVLGFVQSPQFIAATNPAANAFAANGLASNWSDEVFRLYQATLDRVPDMTGQTNWTGRLADGSYSLEEVADSFVRSPQFKATYSDNLSNTEFVTLLYNNVLDRAPDDQGLARWVGELDNGASRADVVLGFSQSPQFQTNTTEALKTWMRDQGVHDRIDAGAGHDVVAGGQFADVFIFDVNDTGGTSVMDLESWDYIDLSNFGYASVAEARSHMTQPQGNDYVALEDQGNIIIFHDTTLAQITDDMIWV